MDDLSFGAQADPAGGTVIGKMPMQLISWGRTLLEVISIGGLFVLLITTAGAVLWTLWALLDAGLPN